ncbi:MAG: YgjV family protein [Anaerolineaceae bacterium]|nr:YgjV family protein [Anaerolineaceae bacterium]
MNQFAEWLGYLASILIAVSLMMHSVLRLRIINLIGAIVFTIYGVWIQAYPVAMVNGFIIFIDLYFLLEMRKNKEYFQPLRVYPTNTYLRQFLEYYADDIANFFPHFSFDQQQDERQYYFILRDMIPAGLVIFTADEQGHLWAALDYAIPGYRDFKTGRYVFSQHSKLLNMSNKQVVFTTTESNEHAQYLKKIGYAPDPSMGSNVYRYRITG